MQGFFMPQKILLFFFRFFFVFVLSIKKKFRDLQYQNRNKMTTTYEVREVKKIGLLIGYKIVKLQKGISAIDTGYEYDEEEKYKADAKCELMNILRN